jgi:sporulation-control protein spo0M
MGFMDKLKSAAQAVTGGAARVTLEYQPPVVFPGDTVQVHITAVSTGAEVQSRGAFIDLRGQEWVHLTRSEAMTEKDISTSKTTFETSISIGGPFTLAPNETKTWEGTVQVPPSVQPSYAGVYSRHEWDIRGRIDSFGNDPDSGWKPLRVGLKG